MRRCKKRVYVHECLRICLWVSYTVLLSQDQVVRQILSSIKVSTVPVKTKKCFEEVSSPVLYTIIIMMLFGVGMRFVRSIARALRISYRLCVCLAFMFICPVTGVYLFMTMAYKNAVAGILLITISAVPAWPVMREIVRLAFRSRRQFTEDTTLLA